MPLSNSSGGGIKTTKLSVSNLTGEGFESISLVFQYPQVELLI